MKKIILFATIVVLTLHVSAQNINSAYFMKDATQRTSLNPALTPRCGYINIPMLGGISVSASSNSLALDNLLYPLGGELVWFLDGGVPASSFIDKLKTNNKIDVNSSINVIGFGFQSGKAFWTAGIDIRVNSSVNAPKSLFEFVKVGSENDGVYNFKNTQLHANSYAEAYVGYARDVNHRLSVGGRIKFIGGLANAKVYYDDMNVSVSDKQWKVDVKGRFDLSANGATMDKTEDGKYLDLGGINYSPKGLSGYGAGIDLGASYRLLDNLNVSAAINDIGFIVWNKNSTISGRSNMQYLFDGIDLNGNQTNIGDLNDILNFTQVASKSRASSLAPTLNLGGEYSILHDKIGFGLLSSTRFGGVTLTELTASANFRPVRWFSGTLSYSFIKSRFKTFGLALNFNPSWINFMIGTDYMITKVTPQMVPVNARALNVYVGLAVPIGFNRR